MNEISQSVMNLTCTSDKKHQPVAAS